MFDFTWKSLVDLGGGMSSIQAENAFFLFFEIFHSETLNNLMRCFCLGDVLFVTLPTIGLKLVNKFKGRIITYQNCSCAIVTRAIHFASCFCSSSYVKAGRFAFRTCSGLRPSSNYGLDQ